MSLALSQDRFNFVLKWIDEAFPRNLDSYYSTCLCARLISTISVSLLFFHYPNEDDRPQELDSSHQYVVLSNTVLHALPSIAQTFFSDVEEVPSNASQKARKYAKRTRKAPKAIDVTPFRALHLELPASRHEANEMALEILMKQKEILTSYLNIFRLESLADALKRNYIPTTAVEATVKDRDTPLANSVEQVAETSEEVPAAYPHVQPMKAALYFDNAEGFGQWRILISGRANRNLRETRKKDMNLFRITVKKIKELSNGHFSDDNQKRLTGPNIPIPVFEAKMTRDSRLVYQVDCIQDFGCQVRTFFIKVFGIYTHAQLGKRLWDSMGYQLSRKGKEYQRRCTFRANPVHKGDKVIPPASFPAACPADLKTIPDEVPIASDKVLEELHEILVLEKFVAFSQVGILAGQEVVHVFQVSPHEQEIIEHSYSCFVQGRSGTGKTTTMLLKMLGIENSWQQNRDLRPERPRQLFVTQSRMLADKVEEYFIKLLQSLVLASNSQSGILDLLKRQRNKEEAGLVDQDEALNWRENLPPRFSELQDSHFPIFITFDKLSAMIEADTSHPLSIAPDEGLSAASIHFSNSFEFPFFFQMLRSYSASSWVNMTLYYSSRQFIDRFLLGVIKGSEMTLDLGEHFLDYGTYLNLSARTQATFASKRKEIYALFEIYQKMKRDRREYDAADRTHAILCSMTQDGMKGQRIDFLYVDEVQDNMLIDVKVLRAICRNPDGQFWAGDTAQTISVGSSFRFDDLKAFLHRNEASPIHHQSARMIAAHPPKSFQLVTNFRSHGGIVRCAHSIIVLISRFWPYAIDILPEEKGIIDGFKPVFLSGWDQDNVRYESFLFGTVGHHIEFGANQCILVRNDTARDKLKGQVGDVGLIMTPYESKGLEFNDVLLYNFFEDSSVDVAQWRVVLHAIDRAQSEKIPAPTFDENRHAGVCAELKCLYVAITRARKNLWIVDRSETAEPIRMYWSSGNLVQNCTPGTDVPQFAVSSSPEEWATMARTLFSHKRYFQAIHSYERAGMPREKAIAYAYHLREQARGIPIRGRPADSERGLAYIKVAEAFLTSAEEATILRERREYCRIAAEAFLVSEDHLRAAQAFEKASLFTEAAQHYRHAGIFDNMVSVIINHGEEMDPSVTGKLTDVARYFYLQRGDFQNAWHLFSNIEEELEFVRNCDLDIAEVEILVEQGRFAEAADLHIRENRMLNAVEVLLKDKSSKESNQRASQSLLDALWNILSFGVLPVELDNESQANLKRMMRLIDQFELSVLEERIKLELRMFSLIYKADAALMNLGRTIFLRGENTAAALLCFDHYFRDMKRQFVITGSHTEILDKTMALCEYAELVQQFLLDPEPWSKPRIQKLFSFTLHSGGRVCLSRNSLLHGEFKISQIQHSLNEDAVVEVRSFYNLYQSTLRQRVREKLEVYCNSSLSVRVFDPCEAYVSGRCDRTPCQWQHELNHTWFERRLQFHLLQISILHSLQFLSTQRNDIRRYWWFERLYDVINPAHPAFGSLTNVIPQANRHMSRAFDLLKVFWIWPTLSILDLFQERFLSTFLSLADLGSFFDNRALVDHVSTCLRGRPCPAYFMRDTKDGYVLAELVDFLRGQGFRSVHNGATFTLHILSNKVPIEVTTLCRLLEVVAGSFIMATAFKRSNSIHGVTLPRSWILDNIHTQKLHRVQNKDANRHLVWEMTKAFQGLLERVYSGADAGLDHLLHQNKSLQSVQLRVRNAALARLYVLQISVGFNIGSEPIKDLILESITSLRRRDPARMFSSLYSQYVYAQEWRQIAAAVTSSIPRTPLDEIILLVDESKNTPRTFRGVRLVKFKDVDDIRRQLTAAAVPASMLNPTAAPFIPSHALAPLQKDPGQGGAGPSVEGATDETNEDTSFQSAAEEEETESHEATDVAAIIEPIGTNFREMSEEVLAERNSAAKTLQSCYRRLLTNRALRIANPGLSRIRKQQFEDFARVADSIEWPEHSLYRPIFLGALPHLLTCLDYAWSKAIEEKTKVKQQSRSSKKHQEIEALMERQTYLTYVDRWLGRSICGH
ncbi:hypothetical protein F5148DRAFT_976352 [Russula earlei]|uniref:Uncharacterized protein n=1 Tax=Russula earlei TaxID=71964 RepID=A0ACC0UI24_9AGAM|nr:hypothetical protein F5148DRAFT_976352 [Russula earlei]